MSRISGLTCRLRSYLTERLGRLNTTLADLGRRLRATVASRVAENVAGIVREAVEIALAGPTVDPLPPRMTYGNSPIPWDDSDDEVPRFPSTPQEDLFGGSHLGPSAEDDDLEPTAAAPFRPSATQLLRTALSTALQASAWCLRRRKPTPLLTALAVGISAGAVALFGSPLLAAGAATLGSLLALAD
jgi:hypothetical protein